MHDPTEPFGPRLRRNPVCEPVSWRAGWPRPGWPTRRVSVGAEADRAWCVRAVADGDGTWEVFWCERGGRFEWTRFDDESAACFSLFGRLVWRRGSRRRG